MHIWFYVILVSNIISPQFHEAYIYNLSNHNFDKEWCVQWCIFLQIDPLKYLIEKELMRSYGVVNTCRAETIWNQSCLSRTSQRIQVVLWLVWKETNRSLRDSDWSLFQQPSNLGCGSLDSAEMSYRTGGCLRSPLISTAYRLIRLTPILKYSKSEPTHFILYFQSQRAGTEGLRCFLPTFATFTAAFGAVLLISNISLMYSLYFTLNLTLILSPNLKPPSTQSSSISPFPFVSFSHSNSQSHRDRGTEGE